MLALLFTACSAAANETTTTTTIPTTTTTTTAPTTTIPTTTTTVAGVAIDGAPDGLADAVSVFYDIARGAAAADAGTMADALRPAPGATPGLGTVGGAAAVATYGDTRLAVVTAGADVFGFVHDGSGWRLEAGSAPSVGVAPWFGGEPWHVAIVGSDARSGEDQDTARADSIHIMGMDTAGNGSLVGVPRDSYVRIPGHGRSKINASLAVGGPDLMLETFRTVFDVDLDGYVLTGFAGFGALVDDVLLPFEMEITRGFKDKAAKADFSEGIETMDGRKALAFARTRKAFLRGDFQRQLNGGWVLLAGLGGAKLRGPLAVPEMLAASRPHLSTDLSPTQLLQLSLAALQLNPADVDNVVLEGGTGYAGKASVVYLSESRTEQTFEDLADGWLGD